MKSFKHEKLREARNDMTRRELLIKMANRGISITERTLWAWEAGERVPDADILAIIADITKKPIKFFFEAA